jgi:hypothetical protein
MNEQLQEFIQTKQIDSVPKLNLLLFLHRNPDLKATTHDFAEGLYLGDTVLLERIIADLQAAGVVHRSGDRYHLPDQAEVKLCLQHLAESFEHPLIRQHLLDRVRPGRPLHSYQTNL